MEYEERQLTELERLVWEKTSQGIWRWTAELELLEAKSRKPFDRADMHTERGHKQILQNMSPCHSVRPVCAMWMLLRRLP